MAKHAARCGPSTATDNWAGVDGQGDPSRQRDVLHRLKGFLMFRKLKKCMQDFNKSRFVRALGHKKNKLGLAEYSAEDMMLDEENDFVADD